MFLFSLSRDAKYSKKRITYITGVWDYMPKSYYGRCVNVYANSISSPIYWDV